MQFDGYKIDSLIKYRRPVRRSLCGKPEIYEEWEKKSRWERYVEKLANRAEKAKEKKKQYASHNAFKRSSVIELKDKMHRYDEGSTLSIMSDGSVVKSPCKMESLTEFMSQGDIDLEDYNERPITEEDEKIAGVLSLKKY
jgi:hypothetical protein